MTRYDSLVERLREAAQPDHEPPGFSEDVTFEQTASVAVAAGSTRRDAPLAVLP